MFSKLSFLIVSVAKKLCSCAEDLPKNLSKPLTDKSITVCMSRTLCMLLENFLKNLFYFMITAASGKCRVAVVEASKYLIIV